MPKSIYSVVAPPLFLEVSLKIFEQDVPAAVLPRRVHENSCLYVATCRDATSMAKSVSSCVLFVVVVVAHMKMAQKSHFDSDSCLHKGQMGNANASNAMLATEGKKIT
jgi:hypothetical protein